MWAYKDKYCIALYHDIVYGIYNLDLWSSLCTVKPVRNGHSKIDKTKILMTNSSLMKVESIAECSFGAFCNTFDLH